MTVGEFSKEDQLKYDSLVEMKEVYDNERRRVIEKKKVLKDRTSTLRNMDNDTTPSLQAIRDCIDRIIDENEDFYGDNPEILDKDTKDMFLLLVKFEKEVIDETRATKLQIPFFEEQIQIYENKENDIVKTIEKINNDMNKIRNKYVRKTTTKKEGVREKLFGSSYLNRKRKKRIEFTAQLGVIVMAALIWPSMIAGDTSLDSLFVSVDPIFFLYFVIMLLTFAFLWPVSRRKSIR
jgi:hypothetical protein